MSKALYRKYRSTSLAEVVGQDHITDILTRSLERGRIAHAYLLTGPRGVGKTSIARILAFAINEIPYSEEATSLDIIEIDAASNNGVDNIRDLIEKVQIAPVTAKKKIYIIDEVHMLSKPAFNALLKTLEEPPAHAVFILATTDVDKLPDTIISRTQQFQFRAIGKKDIVRHLRTIAEQEGISIDDDALELIAEHGDGSFRDSISLLDQVQNINDKETTLTRERIEESLGLASHSHIEALLSAHHQGDLQRIVSQLDALEAAGIQPSVIAAQLIHEIRRTITARPQAIHLLDELLSVEKAPRPRIKLLIALAKHAAPKPKTVALEAPAPTISAPVSTLQSMPAQTSTKPKKQTPAKPVTQKVVAQQTQPPTEERKKPTGSGAPLDWNALIEYARTHHVAIYSVLKKCTYEQNENLVSLYTGTAFWKKKLDDTRHRINLLDAFAGVGAADLIVETIGTPPPPKDSVAASVAAIMGGGEEVTLEKES